MNERLRGLRKSLNISQSSMAESLGMKQGSYSALENGKAKISERIIKLLANIYKLNINWLETGAGYMFLDFASQGGRVQYIMNSEHHDVRDFSYTSKVSESKIRKVLTNEESLTGQEVSKITTAYPAFNSLWLLSGDGEVYDHSPYKIKEINVKSSVYQDGNNKAGNVTINSDQSKEIELLKEKLSAKDREIELLKEMIELYKNK